MKKSKDSGKKTLEGHPVYPEKEDIYKNEFEDTTIDTDDLKKWDKETDPENKLRGETTTDTPVMGSDLDVPGAELDDKQEETGSEDEENNYYSLGQGKDLEEAHPDDF